MTTPTPSIGTPARDLITAEHYRKVSGLSPEGDDLERANCHATGLGHFQCGWNETLDLPRFMVGDLTELPPGFPRYRKEQP